MFSSVVLNSCVTSHVVLQCVPVGQPPSPTITPLPAFSGKQSLLVSWLMNYGDVVGGRTEIQISRTENYIIVYSVSNGSHADVIDMVPFKLF